MKTKKRKGQGRGRFIGLPLLFAAVIFMPTTIVLLMGMIPTIVAAVIDRSAKGTKALTVGAMNLAGCTPFLIDLWGAGHTIEKALNVISDPMAMSVMYAGAGTGYLISWAMSGLVGTIMIQRGGVRIKNIKTHQEKMIERWGLEVTGEIPLDPYGFSIETQEERDSRAAIESKKESKKESKTGKTGR